MIVVTINYRLGALGWLVTPKTLNGNLGLLDQREALKFVQRNIKNFGGDPNQVTIFGQSAGASSVAVHILSSLSQGLFKQAILESNPWTLPLQTPDIGKDFGQNFVQFLNCSDDLDCLRSKSVDEIILAQVKVDHTIDYPRILQTFYPWTPSDDGIQFSHDPFYAFQQGNYNPVPMIIGALTNEALLFIYEALNRSVNALEYAAGLEYIFGVVDGTEVIYEYPPRPVFGDQRPRLGQIGTDYIFICSLRNISVNIYNKNPVYLYHFDHGFFLIIINENLEIKRSFYFNKLFPLIFGEAILLNVQQKFVMLKNFLFYLELLLLWDSNLLKKK